MTAYTTHPCATLYNARGKKMRTRHLLIAVLSMVLLFAGLLAWLGWPHEPGPPPSEVCPSCSGEIVHVGYGLLGIGGSDGGEKGAGPRELGEDVTVDGQKFALLEHEGARFFHGGCVVSEGCPGWICRGRHRVWGTDDFLGTQVRSSFITRFRARLVRRFSR